MKRGRWRGSAKVFVFLNVGAVWLVTMLLLPARTSPAAVKVTASPKRPRDISVTCPGSACPYTAPSFVEQGLAADVLARINLERAAPERDYAYRGATTALPPLAPAASPAEAAAHAAAEWEATHTTVADYTGPDPGGYEYLVGGNAAAAGDSAGIDDSIMHSYGHALGVLSAAPTEVAIGAACSRSGTVYVTEEFYDTDQATAQEGQARLAAELAQNNVYAQSGGTITTVHDAGGSGPAEDYLPQQPIVAGYGLHDAELYATGTDWTCSGVRYPPGTGPRTPTSAPVVAIAGTRDGGGYYLADAAGAVDVHGDAVFRGDLGASPPTFPITSMVPTADGRGYWMVGADGGVFAFGDAGYLGSLPGLGVHVADIVGLAAPPSRTGYWLAGRDGGVFAFDVPFYGAG
ncbi:MAG: hypothetical protein ACRDYZ_14915 [Acidimicrobiales bacterium]